MTAKIKAEILNCLTIIRGNAELVRQDSTCGKAIHSASVTIATVDRITKILEADHDNHTH